MTIDMSCQAAIIVSSVVANYGITSSDISKRKFGFIAALVSQPFWFYTAFIHGQPGIIIVDIGYTIAYCVGLYNNWR